MNMNAPIDEATAQKALTDLEQAAIDGEPVTPAQLAEARERVTLASLWRKGQEIRAEHARKKAESEARATAKAEVKALLAPLGNQMEEATANAAAAIAQLSDVIDAHNAALAEAARIYRAAKVVPSSARQTTAEIPGIDLDNYARYADGDQLTMLRADGQAYTRQEFRRIIENFFTEQAKQYQLGSRVTITN